MAEPKDAKALDSIVNSLAKALVALHEGREITASELEQFKKAYKSDATWNPIKQNDLVPAAEILISGIESAMNEAEAGLTGTGIRIDWEKPLSTSERFILEEFNRRLDKIAQLLILNARGGITPEELSLMGDSPWEKLARQLLQKTTELVEASQS